MKILTLIDSDHMSEAIAAPSENYSDINACDWEVEVFRSDKTAILYPWHRVFSLETS